LRQRGWLSVKVSYDRRRASHAGEVNHSFTMHPDVFHHGHFITRDRAESANGRWCRMFFAGNTSARAYSAARMGAGHRVLTRSETVDVARDAAGTSLTVLHARDAVRRTASGGKLAFAIVDTAVASIEAEYWLQVLSGADFFLAAPGASFPMSHNAVEAMHAGAIPVIEYPQYFEPPLQDGVNCLTYRGAAELRQRIADALAMDDSRIAVMRRGAVEYYHRYLSLEPMVHRLRDTAAMHGEVTWLYFSFTAPAP
jgi:hypothetical protein